MKKTITIKDGGVTREITATEAIEIQSASHSSYSFDSYVQDIMTNFEATKEESEEIVNGYFFK